MTSRFIVSTRTRLPARASTVVRQEFDRPYRIRPASTPGAYHHSSSRRRDLVDNFRGRRGVSCTLLGMDPEEIAGYSLRRKLGSGSAGTVWQVRDLASGRNAVLKRIPATAIPDQEQLREDLIVLQRVRHPHIARLLEFRETGTEWLLISQYVVAGSLTALLTRRGPLSPGELITLLIPLAEGLDHLHRSGLAHGSVTPANTLFDADGRPVLTDSALRAQRPVHDLLALAELSHHAGGDPAVFTPELFTTTPPRDLPRRLLSLAAPEPIDLAFPQDSASANTTTSPSRPPATDPTPEDDDPIQRARGPLSAPPIKPSVPPPLEATSPEPLPPAKPSSKRKARLRIVRRPKRTRRTSTPAAVNPLSRLTPSTSISGLTTAAGSAPANIPTRPDRHPTRRRPWRRNHTFLGRLVRRPLVPSGPTLRRRLPHPAYGVLAATALGAVVVLVIGLVTVGILDTPAPPAAASDPSSPAATASDPPSPAATEHTRAASEPTATTTTDAAAWAKTLRALDSQRAQAFWALDLAALDRIYIPGSPPWHADRALLSSYRTQQIRVRGLRIQIDSTTVTHRTPTTVTLKTTDHLTAGQAVDHAGTTTPLPPGVPTTRLITLTTGPTTPTTSSTTAPVASTWRISTITPA